MGPRAKRILMWIVIAFVVMGVYKQPVQWGGNANKGIDMVQHAGDSAGKFTSTVFNGQ